MKKTPDKFLKPYDPISTEDRINELWTKSGYFNPDNLPVEDDGRFLFNKADGKSNTFSMVLPPPNVTGTLHTGHAIMLAIEDIMIRYKRMMGYRTLWIPGTDHAAIATQSKVEKELKKKEGKGKHDLGRQEFLKRVEDFAQNSHDTIVNQIKKMGASIDWSREAFTLDAKRNYAVRYAFKEMYDMGLIYRGHRIVNWDPKGQTTISDDEIVYQEEKTKFYYFKYGPFVIGTARPETKFGDKYVVMHPDDERYQKYKHGEKIDLEWINSHITATVIKDPSIDMAFGTGVMTITPYHSNIDFEIAQKYKLDGEQIIDRYGKLLPIAGEFSGMKISEAREKIVEKLKNKGLLEKEEDYVHQIATAERTGGIIEPQVMDQWFIAVNKVFKTKSGNETTLKKMMSEAVSSGKIKILPERFEKNYFHWIENLHDWCISRQIWYGHRIPVWYKKDEMYVGIEEPKGEGWVQDEDTLDTWFSSGLWTFSTMGWPNHSQAKRGESGPENDIENFHPSSVLETGYDILFFWIARMILMTGALLDTIPFETVYLHGLVRDGKGRKMSKSLDNIIDPLDLIAKFGADATRMAMIVGNGPGNDLKLSDDKVKAYKLFANKLWNIARFIMTSNDEHGFEYKSKHIMTGNISKVEMSQSDVSHLAEFESLIKEITIEMDEYKFYIVSEKLYHYVWHSFADKIIEESKSIISGNDESARESRLYLLNHIFSRSLRALHPFMPFITEEIWQEYDGTGLIMIENWG
jgi:valyl-tRNA synthetase